MIVAFTFKAGFKQAVITSSNQALLIDALWVDMINPTLEEEILVEGVLGLNIPTREELSEIEISSRLYKENDALFMTAMMVAQSATLTPKQDAVTFVLTSQKLITIRYIEPQAFKICIAKIQKLQVDTPIDMLTELLDTTIDRLADILEMISRQLDGYSKSLFNPNGSHNTDYKNLLQSLGVNGELNSKVVESLVSFNRLISFFDQSMGVKIDIDHGRLVSLNKDINSLNDHANFLSSKINFLLEATLGLVQIEQNIIIKIFSVAAVIFLPPTLIASMYGMNFTFMPELSWKYGYMLALGMMLVSSWLPYKYFKYRKWL